MENIKEKVATNLIWRLAERFGAQGVSFIVSLVLARMLTPQDYGIVAIVSVIMIVLQVFIDGGLASALIQKKNADDLDYSTVFYFNIIFCIIIYGLLFLCAPLIASFFRNDLLTSVVRITGLTLIVSSIKNVQQAYISSHMMFKKFFYATLGGTLGASILGIAMALMGYGVWALVFQNLFNICVDTLILWFCVPWKPKPIFSYNRLKSLFGFGWKLLVAGLLETLYDNLRQLIIGRVYTASELAFYNKGKHLPNLIIGNINSSLDSILFPTIAGVQDDLLRVKTMTRKSIKLMTYIIFPILVGIACCGDNLINVLFTDKWGQSVFFLRCFCFLYMFYPIHIANLNCIKSLGRSDIYLKLDIIKKILGVLSIAVCIPFGPKVLALGYACTSPVNAIINGYPNIKLVNYSFKEQIKDLIPNICLSSFMGCVVYLVSYVKLNSVVVLIMQIIIGVALYFVLSMIFKVDSYYTIKNILIDMLGKGKSK